MADNYTDSTISWYLDWLKENRPDLSDEQRTELATARKGRLSSRMTASHTKVKENKNSKEWKTMKVLFKFDNGMELSLESNRGGSALTWPIITQILRLAGI